MTTDEALRCALNALRTLRELDTDAGNVDAATHREAEEVLQALLDGSEPYGLGGDKIPLYVPVHMLESLRRWVYDARYPGGFLRSILENDLRYACLVADPVSAFCIVPLVRYLDRFPAACHGSRRAMESWAARPQEERERLAEQAERETAEPVAH